MKNLEVVELGIDVRDTKGCFVVNGQEEGFPQPRWVAIFAERKDADEYKRVMLKGVCDL